MQFLMQLRELKEKVLGWAAATHRGNEDATMYKLTMSWCVGWVVKFREAAEREGMTVIVVDIEENRMGEHELNVQMNLLAVSPQY